MVDPNASIARSFAGHVRKPVMSVVFCQSFLQRLGEMLELFVRNEPCRPQQSGDKAHGSCDFSFHFDQLFSWTHRLAQTEGTKKTDPLFLFNQTFFFLSFPPTPHPKKRRIKRRLLFIVLNGTAFSCCSYSVLFSGPRNKTRRTFFFPFCSDQGDEFDFFFLLFLFFFPLLDHKSVSSVCTGGFFFLCVVFFL